MNSSLKEKNKSPEYQVYLLMLALIFVWGLSWPISKIGLQYMSPVWLSAFRLMIGTLTMFSIVSVLNKFILPNIKDLKIIVVIGLIQIGIFMLLLNVGLSYVDAGRAAILVYTTPIWVAPISIFIFKENATLIKWLGVFFGLAGIVTLFNPFTINWHNPNEIVGNAILLLAALCWSIAILCARHMYWTRSPIELISWQLLVGTIPVILLALIIEPHPHIVWNHTLLCSLFYNGILGTGFAYFGTIVISKKLPPITTSLGLLGVPLLGLIFSAIILHEIINISDVVAMIFILIGLVCSLQIKRDVGTY